MQDFNIERMIAQKICCIFNFGSIYRTAIFKLMDQELGCDFYLGDALPNNVKAMDYSSLVGFRKKLKNIWLFRDLYWQKGSIGILFKPYKHIIMEGEPRCLSSWVVLILAKIMGKKTYPWTHGWYGRESKSKKILKKCFFSLSHHIFLYGDYARELMIKEGFAADKLSCIYNSLDYDNQVAIRNGLKSTNIYSDHFKNNDHNLVFIGRLTEEKRFDLLLSALSILKDKGRNFNLTLIGDGDKKEELIEMAKNLGLKDHVWFFGASYDENKNSEFLYNADLCVSPGNIGLTAMHALIFGTPVITHNNFPYQGPEFESVEDGVTGSFFEYENVDSLADSIKNWFDKLSDREMVRKKCYEVIDSKYNPHCQINLMKEIVHD